MIALTSAMNPALVEGLERVMRRAPRLAERTTWGLRQAGGHLELAEVDGGLRVDQPGSLSYAMAVEFLALGLHELGIRGDVTFLPEGGQEVVARIELLPSARPSKTDVALYVAATGRHWPAGLDLPRLGGAPTAHQNDVLMTAAAAQRARLVWDFPVTSDGTRTAIATNEDTVQDWFSAGRAAAHILVRAESLGLEARLVTPLLGSHETRASLGQLLRPAGYPQVPASPPSLTPAERATSAAGTPGTRMSAGTRAARTAADSFHRSGSAVCASSDRTDCTGPRRQRRPGAPTGPSARRGTPAAQPRTARSARSSVANDIGHDL